jgi:hypothetical protein
VPDRYTQRECSAETEVCIRIALSHLALHPIPQLRKSLRWIHLYENVHLLRAAARLLLGGTALFCFRWPRPLFLLGDNTI